MSQDNNINLYRKHKGIDNITTQLHIQDDIITTHRLREYICTGEDQIEYACAIIEHLREEWDKVKHHYPGC